MRRQAKHTPLLNTGLEAEHRRLVRGGDPMNKDKRPTSSCRCQHLSTGGLPLVGIDHI